MKKRASNNRLAVIALVAFVLSLFSLFLSVAKIGITGAADVGEGEAEVKILTTTSITVWTTTINFSATHPRQSKNSYDESDVQNCDTDNHCGFNITNDGTEFANITIQEIGNLFSGGSYNAAQHFTYNVTMKDPLYTTGYGGEGNCSVGYSKGLKGPDDNGEVGQWRGVPRGFENIEVAICYLNYTDVASDGIDDHRPDLAVVEINITVPADEPSGRKKGILRFIAVEA